MSVERPATICGYFTAIVIMGADNAIIVRHCPDSMSHTRSVLSPPPDTARRPSGSGLPHRPQTCVLPGCVGTARPPCPTPAASCPYSPIRRDVRPASGLPHRPQTCVLPGCAGTARLHVPHPQRLVPTARYGAMPVRRQAYRIDLRRVSFQGAQTLPDSTSHTRSVLSKLPDTARCPSGVRLTAPTQSV